MISDLASNRQRLFWVLHLCGWYAYGVIGKYAYTRAVLEDTAPGYFVYVMVITTVAVLLSLGLRYFYRYLFGRAIWLQMAGLLTGSASAAYLWFNSRTFIYSRWFEKSEDTVAWLEKAGDHAEIYMKVSYMETFVSAWTLMLAWSALYFVIKYYQVFQEVQKSALKSAAMAHEAQLKMLRYQLNPHFLFNTLNAISTLVLEKQTDDANRMVTRLSSFLRHSLDNDPMQKVTLDQELAALMLYLDIEKVRFEDRLQLELDIEDEASAALIPSLLLQPLVENAIKYGIARSETGAQLRIAARVFGGELLLELSDNGPGVQLVDGQIPQANGVGLRNTRERLAELYGSQHCFRLSETEPHGLTISIRIPFQTAE